MAVWTGVVACCCHPRVLGAFFSGSVSAGWAGSLVPVPPSLGVSNHALGAPVQRPLLLGC